MFKAKCHSGFSLWSIPLVLTVTQRLPLKQNTVGSKTRETIWKGWLFVIAGHSSLDQDQVCFHQKGKKKFPRIYIPFTVQ